MGKRWKKARLASGDLSLNTSCRGVNTTEVTARKETTAWSKNPKIRFSSKTRTFDATIR